LASFLQSKASERFLKCKPFAFQRAEMKQTQEAQGNNHALLLYDSLINHQRWSMIDFSEIYKGSYDKQKCCHQQVHAYKDALNVTLLEKISKRWQQSYEHSRNNELNMIVVKIGMVILSSWCWNGLWFGGIISLLTIRHSNKYYKVLFQNSCKNVLMYIFFMKYQ